MDPQADQVYRAQSIVIKAHVQDNLRGLAEVRAFVNAITAAEDVKITGVYRLWMHTGPSRSLVDRSATGLELTYPAPHVALVEPDVFSAANNLMVLRGEDHSKRRTNPTDYLLGGLITCRLCGKRYSGTAAHGKRSRYRYYTCLSRQRSGAHGCDAERLPAEALDDAVLQALVEPTPIPI